MTDTPIEPLDVVIKTPPVTAYAKASLPLVLITNVRGRVEKLAAEGASDEAIIEAIRQESPEIADVVEANATRAPRGWSFYQWVVVILMLISVALAARPAESPPTADEIAQIVDEVISKQPPAPSPAGE